ncbi:Trm112 family protein [Haemophilus haemolyticus]|uniref:Trm112 family protein n=1 Tax=Haemophilus haemolyticus TaxID=726 RepID=UPI000E0E03C6|nr:Trm112 family protein [Haemophilus haemolyticus]
MFEKINHQLLEVIACPRCLARLQYEQENQRLICCYEQIAYPIKNGMPVLPADKSEILKNKE